MRFKVGDVILKSEPFAYVLDDQYRGKFCECCFRLKDNLKSCSQCKLTYYCSKECQKTGWSDHKLECLYLKNAKQDMIPDHFTRLLALIILKTKGRDYGEFKEDIPGETITLKDMMSHKEDIKKDKIRSLHAVIYFCRVSVFLGESSSPDWETFLEIYGKIAINAFGISQAFIEDVGHAFYIGASALDHSCAANASHASSGKTIVVKATEEFEVDGIRQVFLPYIDLLTCKRKRREKLLKYYYFLCNCSLCSSSQKIRKEYFCENEPSLTDEVKSIMKVYKEMLHEALDKVMKDLLEKTKHLPDNDIARFLAILLAYYTYRDCGKLLEAASYGVQTLPAYRAYWGERHPKYGARLQELGGVYMLAGLFSESMKYTAEGHQILEAFYRELFPEIQATIGTLYKIGR